MRDTLILAGLIIGAVAALFPSGDDAVAPKPAKVTTRQSPAPFLVAVEPVRFEADRMVLGSD